MAECYLQIGIDETTFQGDAFPLVFPMSSLIPDTHEHLFRFMDYDLYRLEEPLKEYLSFLDDGSDTSDHHFLRTVIKNLREMHPFFMLCPENVQSFLNHIFADYIRRHFPEQDAAANREMFSRVAIKRLSIDKDPDEMFPYADGSASGVFTPDKDRRILDSLFSLQDRIRRLVFITLDDTNEGLASLPISRRTALYSLAYSPYSLAHITADFSIHPSEKMRSKIVSLDFEDLVALEKKQAKKPGGSLNSTADENGTPDESSIAAEDGADITDALSKLQRSLDELYWNPGASISPALREAILATADVTDPTEITYDVSSFDELLELEVYRMITAGTHIRRCIKCHKYFVPYDKDQEICTAPACAVSVRGAESVKNALPVTNEVQNTAPGKTPTEPGATPGKRSSAKGQRSTKTPLGKSPSYGSYRTRYKTLSARVKAGTMAAGDLEKWRQLAVAKLHLVIDGKLDACEYEQWLKE